MKILDTARLCLRKMTTDDAAFFLRLVNEPSWLQYIGDKGVRTLADARQSILDGAVSMQAQHGFSLYVCELKGSAVPIGICGLLKRETLPEVDIGFAFLPEFCGKGYASESATAVIDYATRKIGIKRLLAITSPENRSSIRLIERLGFSFDRTIVLAAGGDATSLFAKNLVTVM